MKYAKDEVLQYVKQEDVKFIRMAFCDVLGNQKNISIMPNELERAFTQGIAIDASAITGFGQEIRSDLFLHPDPSTIAVLPWRPEHGRVVRMFCDLSMPDGTPFPCDTRSILKSAISTAQAQGLSFFFGTEMEFYLLQRDETGAPIAVPHDQAGYMDIAPEDKGENIRREICLTLEQMGIFPESSHHEEGPGQNEIDFRYAAALNAADNAVTFRSVVSTIAARNGLYADFSPKPLSGAPGNGMHVNISVRSGERGEQHDKTAAVMARILSYIPDITVFLNPCSASYHRFGSDKAPQYITWAPENRSALIRVPAAQGEYRRFELRSPDPLCNPYLAFAMLILAGVQGVQANAELPPSTEKNMYLLSTQEKAALATLPQDMEAAKKAARESKFLQSILPAQIIDFYTK